MKIIKDLIALNNVVLMLQEDVFVVVSVFVSSKPVSLFHMWNYGIFSSIKSGQCY